MDNDRNQRTAYNKARRFEIAKEAEINDALRAFMSHKQGRTCLFWLLSLCKVGQNPFTTNALTTSFQCGELNIGQQLQAKLEEVDVALFLKLLQENKDARSSDTPDTDTELS